MKIECTVEEFKELTNKKIYATLDSSSIAKDLVKKINECALQTGYRPIL